MQADVVISTKNNVSAKAFSLQYVIRAILNQAADQIRIYVADNGSEDQTTSSLRDMFGQKVTVVDTSQFAGNISASRNYAASCGKSEMIFFIDDDMIAKDAESFNKCLRAGRNTDFACGARRLWAPRTWPQLIRHDDPIGKFLSTLEYTSAEPLSVNRITGKNILDNRSYIANFGTVKRRAFETIGGFDETFVGWGYQDTELMRRLCVDGYEYDLFSRYGVDVFHLSHTVDKAEHYEDNRLRFLDKQRQDGRLFCTNHFFEIYENDGFSLFQDFPPDKMS